VRLRSAYFITCREVVKDAAGRVVELRCTYDPETRGGSAPDGRRPKATLHWVSAAHAVPAEVRLYDYLFRSPYPGADGRDLFADLNPDSETVLRGCFVEPSLADVPAARLLLPRSRLGARCALVRPHAHPQGHLGETASAGTAGHGLTAQVGRAGAPRHG
jgi:glutaminyl-tRNA synthetase